MTGCSTINPKNGSSIAHYDYMDANAVSSAVAAAAQTFTTWSQTPLAARLRVVQALGEHLLAEKTPLAALATDEMGKPIRQAEAEVEKCALACRYYAEHAPAMLADEAVATEYRKSYVSYRPLGPILAVMPWNFPYWQVIRCAVPALCAGNTVLLKHADISTGAALALARLLIAAGAPAGAFTSLLMPHERLQEVIADPRIRAVSLTGSERAGSSVAALAGKHLKKTVLELGGSDPYVVLRDADLELAATICSKSRFINNGQSCIAAKRFIIEAAAYDDFVALFVAKTRALRVGDPQLQETDIGPLAKQSAVSSLAEQVTRSVKLGAQVLIGGERIPGPGFYYQPTVLGAVTPQMPVFSEEVFGPVAPMSKAKDEAEALRLAGQSSFGLGGAIFSKDTEKAEYLAREHLAAGFVVAGGMVVSDPRLPFGGIKQSGYGRELGCYGLREFVNIKTVVVA